MNTDTAVKPIVVINLPMNFTLSGGYNAPMELMRALNGNFGYEEPDGDKRLKYNGYWNDYLWFCFSDSNPELTAPVFNVFFPKDFDKTSYGRVEKIIKDAIKNAETITQ